KAAQSTERRPFQSKIALSNKRFTHKVNTVKAQADYTARPQAVNTARPNTVKTARPNSVVVNAVRVNKANAGKPQQDDTRFVDSGCSRHMTGNKLVKDNLVRGLPTKRFENDQTCVACLKGKQHRASCKSKVLNPITKPLFMLHMNMFGPTFVSSLMHKKYCLVVTDDYSRFTWVFFLTTKDET
ncbi:putative ribonuclease H-like domain-containing protein, partial [Tanacetum coccineum]